MVSMWYAVREALAIVSEEGLEAGWARHEAAHRQLWEGLSQLGLEPFVTEERDRLATVNTIKVRQGRRLPAAAAAAASGGGGGRLHALRA
jgi:alanine-glyoxylate transaminase/serine-glyoxylate transaminase/serine-pyruvate transaminase